MQELIDKARFYFPIVYDDSKKEELKEYLSENEIQVRIYKTDWDYEIPETLHSYEELKAFIDEHEKDLKEELKEYLSEDEMKTFGFLY